MSERSARHRPDSACGSCRRRLRKLRYWKPPRPYRSPFPERRRGCTAAEAGGIHGLSAKIASHKKFGAGGIEHE